MLNSMVLVYLALSALMALLVLLNLDVMFVEEKKRELIVLMINGFSVGDAKAYIYRDSIVLTIVGIALGIALGAGMGAFSIVQLQPDVAYWIRGFNMLAAGAGALGAGVLAVAVLLWSLRRIPRFDLTDINRF
jgi:ABC-type antimicrobial peptide transport system permease subunit